MKISNTPIEGLLVIDPDCRTDERGEFIKLFSSTVLAEHGIKMTVTDLNFSRTEKAGTIRGLHYQKKPAEKKLLKVVRGEIFDVVVDMRPRSKTYLKWFGVRLNERSARMVLVPERCAHGFQSLSDDVRVVYASSKPYVPGQEVCVSYADPTLAIDWPLAVTVVSQKDRSAGFIRR